MADNDQNDDEYKFAELDSLDNDPMGNQEQGLDHSQPSGSNRFSDKKDIKRNALIAIGVIVFIMVMYKIIGSFFSGKTEVTPKPSIPPVTEVTTQPVQTTVTQTPVQQVQQVQQQPVISESDTELKNKVSSIEASQQNVRAEVSSLSEQLTTVSNNINNLNSQIASLNQTVNNLANQLARQSEEIGVLMARTQPKQIKPVVRNVSQPIIYYIQAVIPGRAWLIGSNGSTLTVREGTKIAGYGVVKLIDSIQGRVLMSSGRIIRFSQEDS